MTTRRFAASLSGNRDTGRTYFTRIVTPVGGLLLVANEVGLKSIFFEAQEKIVPSGSERGHLEEPFRETVAQLESYFDGKLKRFNLLLAPSGTTFQLEVWRKLMDIPYGSTITYSALAVSLGRAGAARAVGSANGRNPLPIIVPCHRVIGSNGALTGYGGGIHVKQFLLNLESTAR